MLPAKIRLYVPHRGKDSADEFVRGLLDTGKFDDLVQERAMKLGGQAAEPDQNFLEVVNSASILARQNEVRERRASAEKPRSKQDIDADKNIGVVSQRSSREEILSLIAK